MGQRFSRFFAPRLRWRRTCRPLALLAVGAGSLIATQAWGLDVANQTDWNTAVAAVAAAGANSTVAINITGGFTLTSSLAQLQASAANVTVVITGNGQTIDGASAYQGIQVSGANGLAVQISSLSIANAKVVGGTGGAGQNGYYNSSLSYGSGGGGGGGLGAGGGLYVGSGAHVTLSAVTFSGDNSTGGVGGAGGNAQNGASSGTGGDGGAGGVMNGGASSVGGGAPAAPAATAARRARWVRRARTRATAAAAAAARARPTAPPIPPTILAAQAVPAAAMAIRAATASPTTTARKAPARMAVLAAPEVELEAARSMSRPGEP